MIRPITAADIPGCMALKQAAGWNQTEADWRLLLAQAPETAWVEELDGQVVGSATAVCYSLDLAWIGMVLVLPEYRRRGVGRRLLVHAIERCDALGVKRLALDATEMGRPLYLSLGFVDQEPIERWGRSAGQECPAPLEDSSLSETNIPVRPPTVWKHSLDLDLEAFGADRGDLLQRLAALPGATCVQNADGFAMTRPGSNARYLGPVTAKSPAAAERVCRTALEPHRAEALFFDILPLRRGFSELAESLGFQPLRKLMRMSRPAAPLAGPGWICSAAGFELG